ncbi:uncharacterized protein LOC110986484 [Acanthaster planci]|uniref:Uncharacterized protein LOC110986484 n=1 Tax=Acanthaster planci TaxID=133434 RepID=A0A8B7ZL74_ACAPL|nr:uncharacterized protein LOC110986484 [Acanthaster planci]
MAGVTIESVLERISQGHLDCPICSNRFKQPKILECLHSFCTHCLEDLCQAGDPNSPALVCPTCRKETRLSKDGVSALRNNFPLTALVEEFNKQEELLRVLKAKDKREQCNSKEEVVSKCTDCDHFMCVKCKQTHEQLESTRGYKVVATSDVLTGTRITQETPRSNEHDETRCENHGDLVHFYCNTCDLLICTTCTVLDHCCPEHDFVDISLAEETCKQEVQVLLHEVEHCKREIQDALELTEIALCRLKATASQAVSEITDMANREVDRVRQREIMLKKKVAEIDQERSAQLEKSLVGYCGQLQRADKTVHRIHELLEAGNSLKILSQKQGILSTLKNVAGEHSPPKLDELVFETFDFHAKEVPHTFGQFVLSKWKLRAEFGAEAGKVNSFLMVQEINIFANGDIVTVDADQNKVSVHDSNGHFKYHFGGKADKSEQSLNVPSRISVSHPDNRLFLVDGRVVKVFNSEQAYLYSFTPSMHKMHSEYEAGLYKSTDDTRHTGERTAELSRECTEARSPNRVASANKEMEGASETRPELVAEVGSDLKTEVGCYVGEDVDMRLENVQSQATSDVQPEAPSKCMYCYALSCLAISENIVAIGDEESKMISLHSLDGSLIRTLPANLIEDNLAINDSKELVFTNYQESRLESMDLYGNKVFSVTTTHRGKLVKPTGVCCEGRWSIYLGLGRGTGEIHHYDNEGRKVGCIIQQLCNPLGLALTPASELAVADKNSIKIFQKVKCYTEINHVTYV